MRTTVTLDRDTESMLRRVMAESRVSFKRALNDAIRQGLQPPAPQKSKPFRVKTFRSGFQPGVDPGRLNQMLDELEVEDYRSRALERAE